MSATAEAGVNASIAAVERAIGASFAMVEWQRWQSATFAGLRVTAHTDEPLPAFDPERVEADTPTLLLADIAAEGEHTVSMLLVEGR